jgi:SAM-dependent methyltransferase
MARYDELLDDLRTAYDGGAEFREGLAKTPWKLAERATFLDRLREQGCHRLLEVGAGAGHDCEFFAGQGLEVVATDLSPVMVEYCRAKGLDARVMDVLGLDFPRASFDAVYTVNCLLHIPNADLPQVLASIADVLRPGGLCYVAVYGVSGNEGIEGVLETDDHVPKRFFSRRTDEQLQRYAAEWFDIVDFHTADAGHGFRNQALTLRRPSTDA